MNLKEFPVLRMYHFRLFLSTLWVNAADDIFFFFSENRIWHFMQIVSIETICMKSQNLFSVKNRKKYFNIQYDVCWNFTQGAMC